MVTENDPLAEPERTGPCTRCDGGLVTVKAAYAVHHYPDPTLEQLAGLTAEQVEVWWAGIVSNRRAAAKSVYPCRECRPEQFYWWAGGHMDRDHNRLRCAECVELAGGRRAAPLATTKASYPDSEPTPRRDIDD